MGKKGLISDRFSIFICDALDKSKDVCKNYIINFLFYLFNNSLKLKYHCRFQKHGMNIGVSNEALDGIPIEESESEEEEEEIPEGEDPDLVRYTFTPTL